MYEKSRCEKLSCDKIKDCYGKLAEIRKFLNRYRELRYELKNHADTFSSYEELAQFEKFFKYIQDDEDDD